MLRILIYGIFLDVVVAFAFSQHTGEPKWSNIVDVLSSKPEYSHFVRILQFSGMIPYLNGLANVTLLAPTNEAYSETESKDKLTKLDNHRLSRYIIDQPVYVERIANSAAIYNTIYTKGYPKYRVLISRHPSSGEYQVDNDAHIVDLDAKAEHQNSVVQGINKVLPYKLSFCELLSKRDADLAPNGIHINIFRELLKSLFTDFKEVGTCSGGVSYSMESDGKVIEMCEDVFGQVSTVLIPSDVVVISMLSELKLNYYMSLQRMSCKDFISEKAVKEIKTDIRDFLENFMLYEIVGGVNGTSLIQRSINQKVDYRTDTVNSGSQLVLNKKITSDHSFSNIVTRTSIFHVFNETSSSLNFFEELNIPLVQLSLKKLMNSMNFSFLKEEFEYRSLEPWIDGTSTNQTLFLGLSQRDNESNNEAYQLKDRATSFRIPHILKAAYQFLNIRVDSQFPYEQALFDTRLCSKDIGSCFKVKLLFLQSTATKEHSIVVNDHYLVKYSINDDFGNVIHFTDQEILLPSLLKNSLMELLFHDKQDLDLTHLVINKDSLLSTLGYIYEFGLLNLEKNLKGYTIFLPCAHFYTDENQMFKVKDPWNSLGLISKYLEKYPYVFERILKNLFYEGYLYSDFSVRKPFQSKELKSLNGDYVNITNSGLEEKQNLIMFNNSLIPLRINSDIFFNKGVVHLIDRIILPEDFHVPMYELIQLAVSESLTIKYSFLDLIEKDKAVSSALGLSTGNPSSGYSILVPSSKSMKNMNMTTEFSPLHTLLELHLVPPFETNKLLQCVEDSNVKTSSSPGMGYIVHNNVLGVSLNCYYDVNLDTIFLRMNTKRDRYDTNSYNKDHEVKILSHGCTSQFDPSSSQNVSCVFKINKPLNLEWLNDNSFLNIHIGIISVGVGILLGLSLCAIILCGIAYRFGIIKQNYFFKLGDFSPEDSTTFSVAGQNGAFESNETDPLLSESYPRIHRNTDLFATSEDHVTKSKSIKGNSIKKQLDRDRNLPMRQE